MQYEYVSRFDEIQSMALLDVKETKCNSQTNTHAQTT